MKEYYRIKSKNWSKNDIKQKRYNGHKIIEKAFTKIHKNSEQLDILDLGCGTGSLARFLRSYAKTLDGVDLSSDMLKKAKKTNLYDNLYEKDINRFLDTTKSAYDTVVAAAVLIHFFELDELFCLIRTSLRENGIFIFSVFEETKELRGLNSSLLYTHSEDYINPIAHRLNFEIIHQQRDVHEYQKDRAVDAIVYILKKNPS